MAAGLALASAIALKASAGILVPVVLAGLLRAPRRLVQVVVGSWQAGPCWGVCSVVAFGFHLPNLGTQGRLVIPMSLPNVVGLVLGQGGETNTMRLLLSAVLAGRCSAARARVAAAGRVERLGLGDGGAAGDAQLGAAVVRAVGAAARGALTLARAAPHGAGGGGVPGPHVDALGDGDGQRDRPAADKTSLGQSHQHRSETAC